MIGYSVRQIKNSEAKPWILLKHYAHRMPPISFAFGLYKNKELWGICTYGMPATNTLRLGICGEKYRDRVFELNRLCLENNIKNEASYLIGQTFRLLPQPLILVSYADASKGHVGYIYQATNWFYTGCPQNHARAVHLDGIEIHYRTLSAKGLTSIEKAKKYYGDRLEVGKYESKHRYIYFLGNKKEKKQMRKALKYPILSYPKGDSIKFDSSNKVEKQLLLL